MYCFECHSTIIKLVDGVCPIHNILSSYYIEDGTDVGESDGSRFYSYTVGDAWGTRPIEFLDRLVVSKIDQDGGEIDTVGFDDTPSRVQNVILDLVGLTWDDINKENT